MGSISLKTGNGNVVSNVGSISIKKQEMTSWEYGINIYQKNMNWNLVLNIGSISTETHEMEIW